VGTEEDILDLIRELPGEVNNAGTTTEFKFLTVGSVLWACRDEIVYLRRRVKELENARSEKGKKVR
jgi:hypothetical protein